LLIYTEHKPSVISAPGGKYEIQFKMIKVVFTDICLWHPLLKSPAQAQSFAERSLNATEIDYVGA
jgi:hypothetical protein